MYIIVDLGKKYYWSITHSDEFSFQKGSFLLNLSPTKERSIIYL